MLRLAAAATAAVEAEQLVQVPIGPLVYGQGQQAELPSTYTTLPALTALVTTLVMRLQ